MDAQFSVCGVSVVSGMCLCEVSVHWIACTLGGVCLFEVSVLCIVCGK